MRGSRKFCQRGSNFDTFFLVDEGREDPSTTVSGPSSAHQKNAIKWRFAGVPMMADDGPTLNAGLVAVIVQGIRTCIARKPYIFVIYQGEGS